MIELQLGTGTKNGVDYRLGLPVRGRYNMEHPIICGRKFLKEKRF